MMDRVLWLASRQAAKHLGISYRTLRNWRDSEHFHPGTHYRRKGPNPYSEMIYNIKACEEAITQFTANASNSSPMP